MLVCKTVDTVPPLILNAQRLSSYAALYQPSPENVLYPFSVDVFLTSGYERVTPPDCTNCTVASPATIQHTSTDQA